MGNRSVSLEVMTVGHSNRELEEFIELLNRHQVRMLADIRTYPNSRRYPHFSLGNLETSMDDAGIDYQHRPELGGMRSASEASENSALSGGFQAVADHLNSPEGQDALDGLEECIRNQDGDDSTGLMCAEWDPGSCHRSLIADHLLVRGIRVVHRIHPNEVREHELHPHARRKDGRVMYPGLV